MFQHVNKCLHSPGEPEGALKEILFQSWSEPEEKRRRSSRSDPSVLCGSRGRSTGSSLFTLCRDFNQPVALSSSSSLLCHSLLSRSSYVHSLTPPLAPPPLARQTGAQSFGCESSFSQLQANLHMLNVNGSELKLTLTRLMKLLQLLVSFRCFSLSEPSHNINCC